MRITLIEECRQWWKLWSVRLAAIAGVIAAVLSASPGLLTWLVNEYFPAGPLRIVVSAVIGVVVFVIPTLARLAQQPKLKEKTDDARE